MTLLSINAAGSDLSAGVHNFTSFCFSLPVKAEHVFLFSSESETRSFTEFKNTQIFCVCVKNFVLNVHVTPVSTTRWSSAVNSTLS